MVTFTVACDDINVVFSAGVTYSDCGNFIDHYSDMANDEEIEHLEVNKVVGNCADERYDYLNERFWVSGELETPVDESRWKIIVGKGNFWFPAVTETEFRSAIDESPNNIVYRYCKNCASSHKHIYYKRITEIPPKEDIDFLDLFMNEWKMLPANALNSDF